MIPVEWRTSGTPAFVSSGPGDPLGNLVTTSTSSPVPANLKPRLPTHT